MANVGLHITRKITSLASYQHLMQRKREQTRAQDVNKRTGVEVYLALLDT